MTHGYREIWAVKGGGGERNLRRHGSPNENLAQTTHGRGAGLQPYKFTGNELEGATIVGERKKWYVMDKSWYEWRMTNQRKQERTSKISDDNESGGGKFFDWLGHTLDGTKELWYPNKGHKINGKPIFLGKNGKWNYKQPNQHTGSPKVAKGISTTINKVGIGSSLISIGIDINNAPEGEKMHVAGRSVSGLGGAMVGAKVGAYAGAKIGTIIYPGIGTAAGAAIGAILFGIAGEHAIYWIYDKNF